MNSLIDMVAFAALLGSAIVGGVFYAFSSFIMKALGKIPDASGIAAMQSINIVVINASFLGAFMGTAALSVIVLVLAMVAETDGQAWLYSAGAISYVVGTFAVTVVGNIPLNNRLAVIQADDPQSAKTWTHYLRVWTRWNTFRTVAALLAVCLFTLGLIA